MSDKSNYSVFNDFQKPILTRNEMIRTRYILLCGIEI